MLPAEFPRKWTDFRKVSIPQAEFLMASSPAIHPILLLDAPRSKLADRKRAMLHLDFHPKCSPPSYSHRVGFEI